MNKYLARTTAIGLTAALALTAMMIFLPSAAAQQQQPLTITLSVAKPDVDRVLPDTGIATIRATAQITATPASTCIVTVKVTWSMTGSPTYSTPILNPATGSITFGSTASSTGANPETKPATTDIIVTVNRNAPAFEDGAYKIKVHAVGATPQQGCNIGEGQAEQPFSLKNDYLPLTSIAPSTLFLKTGQNKKVVFPVEVSNLGNGPTRVKIDAVATGKNKLDALNAGSELRLQSKAGTGAAAQFKSSRNIEAQTPHANGYTNSIYSFVATFDSSYDGAATGQLQTDQTKVTFSVQVQGVYVPGFEGLGLLVALGIALAGLAFVRGRRQA